MDNSQGDWTFCQCFGEKDDDEEFSEADILSTVEFDSEGDFLATGDKGGRIVVFERADSGKVSIDSNYTIGYKIFLLTLFINTLYRVAKDNALVVMEEEDQEGGTATPNLMELTISIWKQEMYQDQHLNLNIAS